MGYTHFAGVDTKLLKINGTAVTTHLGIDGVTASAAEVNALTSSGIVTADLAKLHACAAVIANAAAAHAHIADVATFSASTDTDTAAHLKTALDGIGTKINAILVALETFGINASS